MSSPVRARNTRRCIISDSSPKLVTGSPVSLINSNTVTLYVPDTGMANPIGLARKVYYPNAHKILTCGHIPICVVEIIDELCENQIQARWLDACKKAIVHNSFGPLDLGIEFANTESLIPIERETGEKPMTTATKKKPGRKATKHKQASRSELLDLLTRLVVVGRDDALDFKPTTARKVALDESEPHVLAAVKAGVLERIQKVHEQEAAALAARATAVMQIPVEPEDCPAGCVPVCADGDDLPEMDSIEARRFVGSMTQSQKNDAARYLKYLQQTVL